MTLDTAVIPGGGRGTRLHPITRWLPKEILPVGLRPILYWTLDDAADAGLLPAIIVTNPDKPLLAAAARTYQRPLELEFVPQDHPRGLGDALLPACDPLAGSPFLTLGPDTLFQGPNPTAEVAAGFCATGLATVLLAEHAGENGSARGVGAHATVRGTSDGALRATDLATGQGTGGVREGGTLPLVPRGRRAVPGGGLEEFEVVGNSLPARAQLGEVPLLPRLARRGALAGVVSRATSFDVGVPEGYRDAVSAFPLRA